mgnify:CR=1 FL=1
MREFNASNPEIRPYIEWLRNAMAPEPHGALNMSWYPKYRYRWFDDGLYYRVELDRAVRHLLR